MLLQKAVLGVPSIALILSLAPPTTAERTFSERVDARIAVERVYQSHRTHPSRPSHDAVPRSVVEQKVETAILQELALERYWSTSISGEALTRELERIARDTRYPERLEEIFAALDDDAPRIFDALVRPALVDRLSRGYFSWDDTVHADSRAKIESVRLQLIRGLNPRAPGLRTRQIARDLQGETPQLGSVGSIEESPGGFHVDKVVARSEVTLDLVRYSIPKISWDEWWAEVHETLDGKLAEVVAEWPARSLAGPASCPDGVWDNGSLDDSTDPRRAHRAVWTGSEMIVVGGGPDDTAARYDPLLDVWTPTSPSGQRRFSGHTAVWTGTEVIVWGGELGNVELDTGERYDPVTDTWTPTSIVGAPSPRKDHTAVWTGTEMIVWGGSDLPMTFDTGGRYDPATDSWNATSLAIGVPLPRRFHTAVWTGSEMVVWGGIGFADGGRYDPTTDSWAGVNTVLAPSARSRHSAVWTGSEMVIWGGDGENTGALYTPASDSWTTMSIIDAPSGRQDHQSVWTGSEMVIWGGWDAGDELDTGGVYDPVGDSWTATSMTNAPDERTKHTAVWTGERMIVWGGSSPPNGFGTVKTGGSYDPATDSWTPTSTGGGGPTPRGSTPAVWTGSEMIVWGGFGTADYLADGRRYDPLLDVWTPMKTSGAPVARANHAARWTGDELLVWGGVPATNTGGRYDPLADSWLPTSTVGAPLITGSLVHDWSGSELLVWGLANQAECDEDSVVAGGRYDPTSDSWTPMNLAGGPSARRDASGVWVGSDFIVWGGWRNEELPGEECMAAANEFELDTGSRYDPLTDGWSPTSLVGTPAPRGEHGVQTDGERMFVWGGGVFGLTNTGGLYDPATDQWDVVTTLDAPPVTSDQAIVWTGREFGVSTQTGGPGGLYDPQTDSWSSIASENAPDFPRTGVWTGEMMIVWGLDTGGRYRIDIDHDGVCNSVDVCPLEADPDQPDADDDNHGDACDNCVDTPNPGQESAPLGQTILAQDRETFTWTTPLDVHYAIGDLDGVGIYNIDVDGSLAGATSLTDVSLPAAGNGLYYVVRPECSVGSWQTVVGDEPLRDADLP